MEMRLDKRVYPNLKANGVELRSAGCKGRDEGGYITLNTTLDGCGTTHNQTDTEITYWNEVISFPIPSRYNSSEITRNKTTWLPFYCTYDRRGDASTSFKIKRTVSLKKGSFGTFTFIMDMYRTSSYRSPYQPADYPVPVGLDKPLYVQYSVRSTKANLRVLADRCVATTTGSPNSWPRYTFLDNGCIKDYSMSYYYNPGAVQRFAINSFQFIQQHQKQIIYLHCTLLVCHSTSAISRCNQGCVNGSVRARRAADDDDEPKADLYLALKLGEPKGASDKRDDVSKSTLVGVGATFGGLFLLVSIVLLIFIRNKYKPRMRSGQQEGVKMDAVVASYEQQGAADDEKEVTL